MTTVLIHYFLWLYVYCNWPPENSDIHGSAIPHFQIVLTPLGQWAFHEVIRECRGTFGCKYEERCHS